MKGKIKTMYEDFFAERLAALRIQKNVSAREMSLAIGQNPSYINRIENKQTFPSMQGFFYICEYLEITPQEFFNDELLNPVKYNTLLSDLEELDSEQMDIVGAVVKGLKKQK